MENKYNLTYYSGKIKKKKISQINKLKKSSHIWISMPLLNDKDVLCDNLFKL
jgi:hypothetical protein